MLSAKVYSVSPSLNFLKLCCCFLRNLVDIWQNKIRSVLLPHRSCLLLQLRIYKLMYVIFVNVIVQQNKLFAPFLIFLRFTFVVGHIQRRSLRRISRRGSVRGAIQLICTCLLELVSKVRKPVTNKKLRKFDPNEPDA